MTDQQPYTAEELAAIQARCDAATPGPWESDGDSDESYTEGDVSVWSRHTERPCHDPEEGGILFNVGACITQVGVACDRERATGHFIAHARTDIPRLLSEVAALREQLRLATIAEATAEAEVAALRADKERLDWLSGEGVVIRHGDAFGGHTQLLDDASHDEVGLGKDLRAAIDAARSGGEGEG